MSTPAGFWTANAFDVAQLKRAIVEICPFMSGYSDRMVPQSAMTS
jgi:hypothetical protein